MPSFSDVQESVTVMRQRIIDVRDEADFLVYCINKYQVLLERALPYVSDMVGIASDARFLEEEIKSVLEKREGI